MAILEFRNAYYRGWFAARAHRQTPQPDMREEFFFIDIGFTDGKMSAGGPLEPWNKSIEPGMPANLESLFQSRQPVFTTRREQEPAFSPPPRPARPEPPVLDDKVDEQAATQEPSMFAQDDAEGEKPPAALPEKKPSFSLPSRPAYGGGAKVKRRPVRFKG